MGTLESEVNEMKALNLRLMEENKALTNRKATLEKFLQLKEEQISVLQEGANVRATPFHPCQACYIFSSYIFSSLPHVLKSVVHYFDKISTKISFSLYRVVYNQFHEKFLQLKEARSAFCRRVPTCQPPLLPVKTRPFL